MTNLTIAQCQQDSAVIVFTALGLRTDRWNVTFDHVVFRQNGQMRQGIRGGAVRSADDCLEKLCIHRILKFYSCTFSQNQGILGGALFLENTGLIVQNSVFTENDADLTGGAIYINNRMRASVSIKASSFTRNRAHGEEERQQMEMVATPDASNETVAAYGFGGAIYAFCPYRVTIDASTFERNVGCYGGGAIAVANAALDVAHNRRTSFHLSNSHFESNVAYCGSQKNALMFELVGRNPHRGGAFLYEHLDDSRVEWTLSNSTFYRNRARTGGGLLVQSTVVPLFAHNISSCVFDENSALVSAGGFGAITARINMMNTTVRNSASVYAGGILAWRGAFFSSLAHPADPEAVSIVEGNIGIYAGGIYSDTGGQ